MHGSVVQKPPVEAIFWAFVWNCRAKVDLQSYLSRWNVTVFSECCAVLLSNGRGLGRSLGYVGRSQVSLFVMLHAALAHKLLCEAIPQAFAWDCRAKAALQNYFLSLCMELLFKTCSAKLFFELLRGTVVQMLPCETIASTFAWNCRAKAALQNYFLSVCMELSYKSCLAILSRKLLHAAVVQKPPRKTIS